MKRMIFIALAMTLVLGMVLVPSVAAVDPIPITIHKTIPAGGPVEDFTFQVWRDLWNDGIIDGDDFLVGTVVITGAGTGVVYTTVMGPMIIREVLIPGSAYQQLPDQLVSVTKPVEVTFENEVGVLQVGEIVILKEDGEENPLAGATFEISPNPKTGELPALTVVDEGLNDEALGQPGVLQVTGCLVCVECNVTETDAPDGYELDPTPQTAHVTTAGETVTLTFINTEETCELTIYKVDGSANALAGACFNITPDPKTGTGVMTVCDNGLNDEDPADGVLSLSELMCGLVCTVEETVVPEGYVGADPQTVTIGETLELTFVNTPELSCGTVCAAQTRPGEYLFSDRQANWFTWIYYDKGWGTEAVPYEYPIYTGITTLCGTLYVYDDGTHIFVNYVLTDTDTCTLAGLSEYHLQVDRTFADLKSHIVKGKNPVPGKAEYKGTFDPMQPETGWIEAVNDDISSWTTAYIFAHGVGCYYCA